VTSPIRARTVVAVAVALLLVGCGNRSTTTTSKAPATKAAIAGAVRDYRGCGLVVLTPAAQADCVERLLARLSRYQYDGPAAALYGDVRSTGATFERCLRQVAVSDISACPASPFYSFISQLADQYAPPGTA